MFGVEFTGLFVRINPATGAGQTISNTGYFGLNSLAADSQGVLYSAARDGTLITINPHTGVAAPKAAINFGADAVSVRGLAFSPGGELYAINSPIATQIVPHDLWKINVSTGVGTKVGHLGSSLQGLDFGPDGRLYGYDFGTEGTGAMGGGPGLSVIDPFTAHVTDLDPTVPSSDTQTILFVGDKLYGASGALYELNPASGARQLIGNISNPFQQGFIRGIEDTVPEPTSVAGLVLTGLCWLLGARIRRG
jgi:hypothetical protein